MRAPSLGDQLPTRGIISSELAEELSSELFAGVFGVTLANVRPDMCCKKNTWNYRLQHVRSLAKVIDESRLRKIRGSI